MLHVIRRSVCDRSITSAPTQLAAAGYGLLKCMVRGSTEIYEAHPESALNYRPTVSNHCCDLDKIYFFFYGTIVVTYYYSPSLKTCNF